MFGRVGAVLRAGLPCQAWSSPPIPALDGWRPSCPGRGKGGRRRLRARRSHPMMAGAYPASTFTGYDSRAASIGRPAEATADAGLRGARPGSPSRARRRVPRRRVRPDRRVRLPARHGPWVTAAAHIRQALADDGTFLSWSPAAAVDLTGSLNPVGRLYYAFYTCCACQAPWRRSRRGTRGAGGGGPPSLSLTPPPTPACPCLPHLPLLPLISLRTPVSIRPTVHTARAPRSRRPHRGARPARSPAGLPDKARSAPARGARPRVRV